jgi:hypothetical protein
VPGSAHIQWLDPARLCTHDADWVSYKEWWYRKRFRVPRQMSGRRVRLEFDATDCYADAFLNGQALGRHEGYIDPHDYDVTAQVKCDAGNELLLRVWTPVTCDWRHRPYYVKGSYGNVDQKPDDITALGITRGPDESGVPSRQSATVVDLGSRQTQSPHARRAPTRFGRRQRGRP